jgi:plasmid maintenance system killer protein
MEVVFKNEALRTIYEYGQETGKPVYGKEVIKSFIKKIDIIASVNNSRELAQFKSLHLEALKKEERYKGMHSVRVNDKFRVILKIVKSKNGNETIEISEIHDLTDYH